MSRETFYWQVLSIAIECHSLDLIAIECHSIDFDDFGIEPIYNYNAGLQCIYKLSNHSQ